MQPAFTTGGSNEELPIQKLDIFYWSFLCVLHSIRILRTRTRHFSLLGTRACLRGAMTKTLIQ